MSKPILLMAVICLCVAAGCAVRLVPPAAPVSSHAPVAVTDATHRSEAMVKPEGVQNNTPFGHYDAAMVNAIKNRWYEILDSRSKLDRDRRGQVILQFRLHSDGTVSNFKTEANSAGELLGYVCLRAIKDVAPFAPWPPGMAKVVGKDYRVITFTFECR